MVALRCMHAPSLPFGMGRSVPIKMGRGISMKKFLVLLLCVQLVLCAGVDLAQAAPAAQQADVVIVGAGAAGMTAAISAYETGARNILLVEKLSVVGGGTTCASGGMHACNTQVMQKWGYDETMVDMFATAIRRGVGVGQPAVYGLYIDSATKYVDWLIDSVKAAAESWKSGPYYASLQTVGINHTLGGLVIDTIGRVYNGDNLPIFGLYAGGEVVGNT